jgi:flagellar basal body rod protein FlgC
VTDRQDRQRPFADFRKESTSRRTRRPIKQGYVLYPNVNTITEMMDMREARRGYEANLGVVESSKAMLNQTLEFA